MWTAYVTLSLDYPRPERPGILHLHPCPVQNNGRHETDVTSPEAFAAFLDAHREIGFVIAYDARFPRRKVTFARFIEQHARKIWKDSELIVALREVQRKRVADPNYVPTVEEAARNPEAFVEGMTEVK